MRWDLGEENRVQNSRHVCTEMTIPLHVKIYGKNTINISGTADFQHCFKVGNFNSFQDKSTWRVCFAPSLVLQLLKNKLERGVVQVTRCFFLLYPEKRPASFFSWWKQNNLDGPNWCLGNLRDSFQSPRGILISDVLGTSSEQIIWID